MLPTGIESMTRLRPDTPVKPAFRPDVEGLRAIAVCLVVASHFELGINGGFIGVDVFFVLSGFLITTQLFNEYKGSTASHTGTVSSSLRDFYARRSRRILPAAIFCLSVTVIAAHLLLNPGAAQSTARDGLWSFFFVENFNLITSSTDYFARGFQPSAFQHYWSLSVEEQFYLIWPLLAYLALSRRRVVIFGRHVSALSRLTFTALALSIVSFIVCLRITWSNPNAAYFSTSVRAWELGIGALCACWIASSKKISPTASTSPTALVGAGLLAGAALLFSARTPFPGSAALLPTLGTAFIIIGGSTNLGLVGRVLAIRPLRLVGRLSYSIYLWHWPVLTLLGRRLPQQFDDWIRAAILVSLTLALAGGSYLFIEVPLRKFHPLDAWRQWRVTGRHPALGAPFTMAILLVVAVVALWAPASQVVRSQVVLPSASLDQSDINTGLPAGSSTFLPSGTTTAAAPHSMDRRALQAATTRFKQVVLQSSSISHVPSGLSPTLTQLGVSKGYQDALCHQDRCTYGTGPKNAVLIGNSFADMMYPVVTNALDPAEWTVTIQWKSGCYLAFPSRCPTVFALPQSKIDLLVLSDYEGLNASTTAAQVEAGLATSVKEFSASSDHIVYIGQPPGLKAALVDCVNADLSFSSSCYSDTGAGDLIPEPGGSVTTINALKSRLVTAAGGVFVDPTTWLCTHGQCPPVIGNYPVYVDTQHLDSQLSAQKLSMFFRLDLMTADIVI